VDETRDFLSGKSDAVQKRLSDNMAAASDAMEFEIAGAYRDRLRALSHIQSHQGINVSGVPEADVIAIHQDAGHSCIQVFFFRAGQNWGNRAYFPSHGAEAQAEDVLAAFIGQFYDNKPAPRQILLNLALPESALLSDALSVKAERRVAINAPQRGIRRDLIDHATLNARDALARRLAESAGQRMLLEKLAEVFNLDATPQRVEVYDNSHTMGANAIGAMIVAGANGYQKNAYRKFNIKDESLTPGDDYAMMREVLTRRFSRLMKADADELDGEADTDGAAKDNRRIAGVWPDLVLIDGGPGQLSAALAVFADLGINDVAVAGIAKGPERNAGREKIYRPGLPALELPPRDPTLYFLQRLRDEAHRFAIGTHRTRRAGAMTRSALDAIAGVGAKRKRALLNRFGSVREIERAALSDLETTEGISGALAGKIYAHFHDDG
jgi:excinuclease ABC subunit C